MNRLIALLIMISFAIPCGSINAQSDFKKVGTVGYTFLKLPADARHAGMGETAGSIVRNAGILPLFLNPAVLGFQKSNSVGITGANWIADIDHYLFGVTYIFGNIGSIGIGVNYVDYGEIPRTEQAGAAGEYIQLGTYTAQSKAIGLTYSNQLTDKFAWGMRLNYIREDIFKYASSNILADMGIMYYTGFRSLRLGGFINNFGVDSKFVGDDFKMPTELRLSIAYDLLAEEQHLLIATTELVHPSDNLEKIHVGIEYKYQHMLFARAGYRYQYDEDKIAFGGGIIWQNAMVNLAVTPFGRFPPVYRIGLNYEF